MSSGLVSRCSSLGKAAPPTVQCLQSFKQTFFSCLCQIPEIKGLEIRLVTIPHEMWPSSVQLSGFQLLVMSDAIWVFSIGSGTVMMLSSKIFPEPSCLLPPVLAVTGLPRVPITHSTGLAVTGFLRVPVAHSTYSSEIHQVRSILNSNSSKAFCPAREIHGFQMPTALLLPCHLVHTFTIYFLSLSGILNIASKTAVATSLAFAGSAPPGKPRLTLLPFFFISWRFCAHKRSASHFPSFNSSIIFITWNMPKWSHLLRSKNPWAQRLFSLFCALLFLYHIQSWLW